jgi:epoxyqueuosine reductase
MEQSSTLIKEKALALGFAACGIARVRSLEEERPALEQWLQEGRNGTMAYMSRNVDMRLDPTKIVEGAKSVISVLISYYPQLRQEDSEAPVISKYAYGKDYHFIVKDKLNQLLYYIQTEIAPCNGRPFVDSAPVLERAWAKQAGLGWIGKHGLLISKQQGSFVFIGELIIDLELKYDQEMVSDHCGSCTRCIDACPTQAITAPHKVDARRCISYLTIENKEDIPEEFQDKIGNHIFGCDICQDVCPWNKKILPTEAEEFKPIEGLLEMTKSDWLELDKTLYKKRFKSTPFERAGYEKLKNSISILYRS